VAGRSNAAAGIVAIACGVGAAVGLWIAAGKGTPAREQPGTAPAGLGDVAKQVDQAIAEATTHVSVGAATFAKLPLFRSIVGTDRGTAEDIRSHNELQFATNPGEILDVGQIPIAGGAANPLVHVPPDAPTIAPLADFGEHLSVQGGTVWVSEVIKVVPSDHADQWIGTIAVSRAVDLAPVAAKLEALGAPARLENNGATIVSTKAAIGADAKTVSAALSGPLGKGWQVVATMTPSTTIAGTAPSTPLRGAAAGALLVGIALGVVLFTRKGSAAVSTTIMSGPGTAPAAPAPAASVDQLGRYKIVRPLGSGGMAQVFLARVQGEAGFEKQVALKIMHRDLSQQAKAVEHFLDEARLASKLTHPNIVQITDLGKTGDDYFIAMEYIDGCDLDQLLRGCRERGVQVPVRVALTILRKVCDGLHAAHTAVDTTGAPLELVHRDVKCENVMLSRAGAVKIADFGIAKANQQTPHRTQIGEVKGTAAFMAPEHRTGQATDRRADEYGVGAIAYVILTGTEINLDLAQLAHLGRQGWPHLEMPSKVRSDLPAELDAIVMKALAFDKEDRYADCAALEEAIDAVATAHGLQASDKQIAQWVESELAIANGTAAFA
jgi:serine/threonine-protein kinase